MNSYFSLYLYLKNKLTIVEKHIHTNCKLDIKLNVSLEISCFERLIVAPFWFKLSFKTVCFTLFRVLHKFSQDYIRITDNIGNNRKGKKYSLKFRTQCQLKVSYCNKIFSSINDSFFKYIEPNISPFKFQ